MTSDAQRKRSGRHRARRRVVFLLAILLSGGVSSTAKTEPTFEEINGTPSTCAGVVSDIHEKLDADSIAVLKLTSRDDLIQFHLSWGMGIRNSYGLWSENSQVRRSCAQLHKNDDMHPESASSLIMGLVWDRVHAASEKCEDSKVSG